MSGVLDINSKPTYNNSITSWEYHTHTPFSAQTFNNNDEIRIAINQQDVYTLPGESFLYIEGSISLAGGSKKEEIGLVSNAVPFLFDEIRYEVSSIEIDRTKNVGITTTLKDYLVLSQNDLPALSHTGFFIPDKDPTAVSSLKFTFCVPLKRLLSVFERYNKIILNVRQELVLLRSSSVADALLTLDGAEAPAKYGLAINKIAWKVPYIKVDELTRLKLLKTVNSDKPVTIPFYKWETLEYPNVPATKNFVWTLKTATQSNKPRYAIVGFQTKRKHMIGKNPAVFDSAKITDIKLWLNSVCYPYDQVHGSAGLFYDMYARFKETYFTQEEFRHSPLLNFDQYSSVAPIYVINCTRQDESIKSGSVDVRLDITSSDNIDEGTTAFCILVCDEVVQYTPLTGIVRKVM